MTLTILITTILALVADQLLGEPQRGHPLLAFGHASAAVESRFYRADLGPAGQRVRGVLAVLLLVAPVTLLVGVIDGLLQATPMQPLWGAAVLYCAVGGRSLHEHARAVYRPLCAGDTTGARAAASALVSRDLDSDTATQAITAATIESTLENGSDALFASLFWFWVLGPAGACLHRLANTLDAMWGYRNNRYRYFGEAAARLDDLLGWLPARLCALSYVLAANSRTAARRAWGCWQHQARHWQSSNAGAVMASGAGALGVQLGGPVCYHGRITERPPLGKGGPATALSIRRAGRLVHRALVLWLTVYGLGVLLIG